MNCRLERTHIDGGPAQVFTLTVLATELADYDRRSVQAAQRAATSITSGGKGNHAKPGFCRYLGCWC